MTRPSNRVSAGDALPDNGSNKPSHMQLEPLTVQPPEAWRMLDISPSYGWRQVRAGRLRTIRISSAATLIELSELRDFLKRNASPSPELTEATE